MCPLLCSRFAAWYWCRTRVGFKLRFNVPPGVAGGVNAGDKRDSGRAGVCSPVAVPLPWLASSRTPSPVVDDGGECGGRTGEAWAGRSAIATDVFGRGRVGVKSQGVFFN